MTEKRSRRKGKQLGGRKADSDSSEGAKAVLQKIEKKGRFFASELFLTFHYQSQPSGFEDGFTKATPIQAQSLPPLLAGKDLLAPQKPALERLGI